MPATDPIQINAEELAQQFPSSAGMLYANHAAMSPWARATHDAVACFADENMQHGPLDYPHWLKLENELRERVARMINAAGPEDISLLGNTTDGINTVVNGLDWHPGDRILTAKDEFITNRLAWESLAERGVIMDRVDIRLAQDPEKELIQHLGPRVRVLTISSVQWSDGFRLDLGRLGQACREAGVLFFVDAIQEFGALPMDVTSDQVDCLAAGSHKWQMGPEGMGLFYCREAVRRRLHISRLGWRSLDDPYRFENAARSAPASGRRFESGSPNTMGQVTLNASLAVIESFGLEAVGAQVLCNTGLLMDAVATVPGLELVSRAEPLRRSGIVTIAPRHVSLQEFHRRLKRSGVFCAVRGGGVRLSPHFYQAGKPLQCLLNAIEDAAE